MNTEIMQQKTIAKRAERYALMRDIGRRYNAGKSLAAARAKLKKEWMQRVRSDFKPGEKQLCAVCGKYQSVTHAHHITPLHEQFESEKFDGDYVWLCPTHHEGVHLVLRSLKKRNWDEIAGFDEAEKNSMLRIAAMSGKI